MAYAYETKEYKELRRKYRQLQETYKALEKRPSAAELQKMTIYAEQEAEANRRLQDKVDELEKWQKYPNDETKAIISKLEKENKNMKQTIQDVAKLAAPFQVSSSNLKI